MLAYRCRSFVLLVVLLAFAEGGPAVRAKEPEFEESLDVVLGAVQRSVEKKPRRYCAPVMFSFNRAGDLTVDGLGDVLPELELREQWLGDFGAALAGQREVACAFLLIQTRLVDDAQAEAVVLLGQTTGGTTRVVVVMRIERNADRVIRLAEPERNSAVVAKQELTLLDAFFHSLATRREE